MGAEKRLQRHLDKMGKKYGNTADVEDGREEINEKMVDNKVSSREMIKAKKLSDKVEANNAAPEMNETALYKKMTCWKGYVAKGKKKSPSGKKTKSGKVKMVNNCVKK
jgi:hypothetical protein|tara:strand:- start:41 stop:364 length:324 start_codon:yes stop_codon:yes gene_type:complete